MEMILPVLGGLGLFIFGMNLMGDGLQKVAGSKLRQMIAILTKNRFLGVLVGTVVTMVIQSSSATTVMVVGFVNAGLMNLSQAVGVIMGANLGTTVTGQLIALNLSDIAPIALVIGVFLGFVSKDKKKKDLSEIVVGFGMLFLGMNMMSNGLAPLSEMPFFHELITKLENPWLAMLTGFLLTTVLQSSSASIGILQALAGQNLITIGIAMPILFGENIGTTTTAMISSIGASKNAKRAALIHFLFNMIGTLLFMIFLQGPVRTLVLKWTPGDVRSQIANAHTLFNLVNIVVQFPFAGLLVKASEKLIKGEDPKTDIASKFLDRRMISTPSIAIEQVRQELLHMGEVAGKNLLVAKSSILENNIEAIDELNENEDTINKLNKEITDYIVELNRESLSAREINSNSNSIYCLNDIERIGDHIKNIGELSIYIEENSIVFSKAAHEQLDDLFNKVHLNVVTAISALEAWSKDKAYEVVEMENVIDSLESQYREEHINRLSNGTCEAGAGIMFLDTISNLERISDHCNNIAGYVISNQE
ncbi:MAG: Na/Pi cotransporter family protein [Tissierellia bacterium]|nr:Na/Pi cotransporter family protein [Tissierellia bacterium]